MTTRRYVSDEVEHTEFESEHFQKDHVLAKEAFYEPSPSCIKCTHFKMCKWAANIFPMAESMFNMLKEKDRPINPQDQAKICQEYEVRNDE